MSRPETVSLEQTIEKGHVNRLFAQEKSLQTVIYQNQNGSKTSYVYDKPVKYITSDGEIRDKNTSISETGLAGYSYAMTENSFSAYFGNNASNGIMISFENHSMSMKPENSLIVSPVKLGADGKSIVYNGVFGANTALRYQTQLSGIKEDIVLMSNIGKYSFRFLLTTSGLAPIKTEQGEWRLLDEEGNFLFDFEKILIEDSNGKTAYGDLDITENATGGYTMLITVPAAFLKAADTVYPVFVDPTVIVNEKNSYVTYEGSEPVYTEYDAIIDIGLYNNSSLYNYALSNSSQHNLSEGQGKVIYKFYDFYGTQGQFKSLNPYQIGRATVSFTPVAQIRSQMNIHPMVQSSQNYESQIAVNNSTLFSGASTTDGVSSNVVVTYGDTFSMDVTDIVRGWAKYNTGATSNAENNPRNGFALSQTEDLIDEGAIYSTEATGNSNVYLEIVTSDIGGHYTIRNKVLGTYISKLQKRDSLTEPETTFQSSVNESGCWIIEYRDTLGYVIRPYWKTTYAVYKDSKLKRYDKANTGFHWQISYATGGGAILKNKANSKVLTYLQNDSALELGMMSAQSSSSSSYNQTVWYLTKLANNIIEVQSTSRAASDTLTWMAVGASHTPTLSVQPSNATWKTNSSHHWKSENTDVATVDASGRITGVGHGYTNIIVTDSGDNDYQYKFSIMVGQVIPSGTYHVQNISSQRYMDVEGPSTADSARIQQWAYHTSPQAKWVFNHVGLGYYTIKSLYSSKYVSVANGSTASGASIVQMSTVSDAGRWKLQITDGGNYRFVPKCSEASGMALSLPYNSTSSGVDLVQLADPQDSNTLDEWLIEIDHEVSIISIPEAYNRTKFYSSVIGNLEAMGYTDIYAKQTCMNENFLLNHMTKSEIVVVRTHGFQTGIETSNEPINISMLQSLPNDALSNIDLIIYGACSTGEGREDSNNLVNATHAKGAKVVIGFELSVLSNQMNDWCEYFFAELEAGKTVKEACEAVDLKMNEVYGENNTTIDPYIAGNVNATFN
ncbi:MAG: hypothetical protein E7643_00090 [Ruminococcaceae bacterium]|nr:hypothetical protein [Oscillospiraceae bacterium]